ncbi:hypothetical protein [Actinoplanes sp. NPDC023714]|uniref:hypothetical protein n=1 Tax=Actinoplanes sp. NPDC023714 TaxID=3154322 RepID=UPI0033E47754
MTHGLRGRRRTSYRSTRDRRRRPPRGSAACSPGTGRPAPSWEWCAPSTAGRGRDEGPNLLGWHLGRAVLDFLHATRAVLDVDEYDMTPEHAEG